MNLVQKETQSSSLLRIPLVTKQRRNETTSHNKPDLKIYTFRGCILFYPQANGYYLVHKSSHVARKKDYRAVSPVIANVLLVAITVILSGILLVMLFPMMDQGEEPETIIPVSLPTATWMGQPPNDIWSYNSGDVPYFTGTGLNTNLTSGSMSVWVKLTGNANEVGILGKGTIISGTFDQSYMLQVSRGGMKGQFSWYHNESNNNLENSSNNHVQFFIMQNNIANTARYTYVVISPAPLVLNEWYYVVANWGPNEISIDLFDRNSYIGKNWLNVSNVLSTSGGSPSANAARQTLVDAGNVFNPRPSNSPIIVGGQTLSSFIFRGDITMANLYPTTFTFQQMDYLWKLGRQSL